MPKKINIGSYRLPALSSAAIAAPVNRYRLLVEDDCDGVDVKSHEEPQTPVGANLKRRPSARAMSPIGYEQPKSMERVLDPVIWPFLPSVSQTAHVSGEMRQENCTTPPRTRPAASASSPLLMPDTPSEKQSSKKEQARLQRPRVSGEAGLGSRFAQEMQAFEMQEGFKAYYLQRIDTLSKELEAVNVLIPEMLDIPSLLEQNVQNMVVRRLKQNKKQLESMKKSLLCEMSKDLVFRNDVATYYANLHCSLESKWGKITVHDTLSLNNLSRPCESTAQVEANIADFLRLPHEENSALPLGSYEQRVNVLKSHTDEEVLQRLYRHATSMMHAMRTQCCLRVTETDHAPLVFALPSVDQSVKRKQDSFSCSQAHYVGKNYPQGQLLNFNMGNRLQEAISYLFEALRGLQQKPCIQVSLLKVCGERLTKGLLVVVTMNTPKALQYAKDNVSHVREKKAVLEALERFQHQVKTLIASKDVSVPVLHLDMFTDIGMGMRVSSFAGRSVHAEMTFASIHQVIKKIFPTFRVENNTEASDSQCQALALR